MRDFRRRDIRRCLRKKAHGLVLVRCISQLSVYNESIMCYSSNVLDQNELQQAQAYLEQAAQENLVS